MSPLIRSWSGLSVARATRLSCGRTRVGHRGSVLLLVPVVVIMFVTIAVLAIDWGRLQLVRAELQTAADAAALHAIDGASEGSYFDESHVERAREAAADNRADGRPVAVADEDVRLGQWDERTRKIIENREPTDAVAVTTRASVSLFFGGFVGRETVDVSATAVAAVADSGWGLVGIDSVELQGNSTIDSYRPSEGPYSSSRGERANIASNGDITLSSNTVLYGDARPGPGRSATGGTITGRVKSQHQTLNFPPVDSASMAGGNDNGRIARGLRSGDLDLRARDRLRLESGRYVVNDLKMVGGSVLEVEGQVTIFVTGEVDMAGHVQTAANLPSNLKLLVVSDEEVRLRGTSDLYAHVYAPRSSIDLAGTAGYFGHFVGRSLVVRGTADVHHDETRFDESVGSAYLAR